MAPSNSLASKCLRILSSEYYIVNVLCLSTYVWLRHTYKQAGVSMGSVSFETLLVGGYQRAEYQTWEWQLLTACAATATWRIYRATTSFDAACFTALCYCQLFVAVMAFLVDKVVFGQYVTAYVLSFLLLEQPQYKDDHQVEVLTPATLQEKARDPATVEPGTAYLVMLHAVWSLSSRHAFSTFAELSSRYATDRLHFARLDVGEWPNVARKLNVDASAGGADLPTVILFEGGEERGRLPRKAGPAKGNELSRGSLVRAFELDMRLATSMAAQQQGRGAGGKGDKGGVAASPKPEGKKKL